MILNRKSPARAGASRRRFVSPVPNKPFFEPLEDRRLMSRPSVISAGVDFQTLPQKITTQFDQNVSTSLTAADWRVDRVSASDSGPITTSLTYNPTTNMATNAFAGVLPDGNFRAVLSSEGVTSTGGEFLTADKVLDFFFLSGDVNHDRWVNSDDFNIVSTNFGQAGATLGQGDVNYDGKVDSDDFNVLGTKFGASMAAPPSAPDIVAVSPLSTAEINLQWVDHTDGELGMRVQRSEDSGQNFDWYINLPANTTTWTDTSLQDGKDYTYRVRAYGNGVDTAYTPKVKKFTVLAAPSAVTAFAASQTQMQVEWADLSQSETGYEIRVLIAGSEPIVITGIAPNTTSYTVSGLQAGTDYAFEVRALGGAIGSSWAQTPSTTQTWGTSLEVYFQDFDGGVGNEWSPNDKNDSHPMRPNDEVLGMFDNRTATLNLTGLPQHTSVKLEYTAIAHIENSGTSEPDAKAATWTVTAGGQQVEHYRMDGAGMSTVWSPFGATHTISHTGSSFSASFGVQDMEPEKGETWGLTTVRVSLQRPSVSVSASDAEAVEGGNTGEFTITRSGSGSDLNQPLTVQLDSSVTGVPDAATAGADYNALPDSVTIPSGQSSIKLTVNPTNDSDAEGIEVIPVSIKPDATYTTDPNHVGMVNLDDDVSVRTIEVKARGGVNTSYKYDFVVDVVVTGEHLDRVEIQQLINSSTSLTDFSGRVLTVEETAAQFPNAPANVVNSGGQFVVDSGWGWQGLNVVEGSKNGRAEHADRQLLDLIPRLVDVGPTTQTWICFLAEASNYFQLKTREVGNGPALNSFDWGYKWNNYTSTWIRADGAPEDICASSHKGAVGIFSDVQGISNFQWE